MYARRILMLIALLAFLAPMAQAEDVEIKGQKFPSSITVQADGGDVTLNATGKALRKKYFFKVYVAVAYVADSVEFGDDAGAAIVAAAAPKQVHLRMLRDVESEKITSSINEALDKCATGDLSALTAEREQFLGIFGDGELMKGENLRFTYYPGTGLTISRDEADLGTIAGEAFAKAFFEIYFGPNPVDGDMKNNLLDMTH